MFPKKGKFFPDTARRPGTEISFEAVVGTALREELRETRRSAKAVMEWTGVSERTVKNWLSGRTAPRGPQLICIMRHSPKVLRAVLQLSGRGQSVAAAEFLEMRNFLAEAVRRLYELEL